MCKLLKHITIITGAGISAESGLETFRSSTGLWNNYKIEEVAHIDGWNKDPEKVLKFYNDRRVEVLNVNPNLSHISLVALEQYYNVDIITQNIDDLHERAGSSNILHLHGEILKSRSINNNKTYECVESISLGDCDTTGNQLRPHVVWFGEDVPNINIGAEIIKKTDLILVIGTSLHVYPAASLVSINKSVPVVSVSLDAISKLYGYIHHVGKATEIVPKIVDSLIVNHEYSIDEIVDEIRRNSKN